MYIYGKEGVTIKLLCPLWSIYKMPTYPTTSLHIPLKLRDFIDNNFSIMGKITRAEVQPVLLTHQQSHCLRSTQATQPVLQNLKNRGKGPFCLELLCGWDS